MEAVGGMFHNPSFKKDFELIKQLEAQNKGYQDKIWKKFGSTYNKKTREHTNETRFESHPSGLSSDSEDDYQQMTQYFKDKSMFGISSASSEAKISRDKARSFSGSAIILNEIKRKKLRKKLTHHLQTGTLDKFEIRETGDHLKNMLTQNDVKEIEKSSIEDKNTDDDEAGQREEIYLDRWANSGSSTACSTPKSSSATSIKNTKTVVIDISQSPREQENVVDDKKLVDEHKQQINKLEVKSKTRVQRIKTVQMRDSAKSIPISPSGELRKSRYYIEKCIGAIKDIGMILNDGIIQPDGSDDFSRRNIRTREFTSRFSRVYMYPLIRQLSEVSTTLPMGKRSTLYCKFTSMYQLIYQALQACFNHIPTTVGNSSYQKLKEHLSCAVDVCDRNSNFFDKKLNMDNEEYISILRSQCIDLMGRLDENFLSVPVDSFFKLKNTRAFPLSTIHNSKKLTMVPRKGNLHKRFSMYNTNLASKRDRQWRRMIESIEGKKPKVKSRYRTATFKHRPPIEKQNSQCPEQQKQHRLDDKRSLTLLRNTPVSTPLNEDSIQTMIQYEEERDNDRDESEKDEMEEKDNDEEEKYENTCSTGEKHSRKQESHCQDDILAKLLQLVQQNDHRASDEPDGNLTNTIMVLQQCLDFKNKNSDLFKKMEDENNRTITDQKTKTGDESKTTRKAKRDPVITVTGAKNAQLICIKDDNSIASCDCDATNPNVPQNSPRRIHVSKQMETNESKIIRQDEIRSSPSMTSMKRITRPRRVLKLLPKEYAINVIQYKLMFHKHHKGNYMYRRTSSVKPWELMDKISEDILDYAFLGIAKEIEVNELLENIYNAEFQY